MHVEAVGIFLNVSCMQQKKVSLNCMKQQQKHLDKSGFPLVVINYNIQSVQYYNRYSEKLRQIL